MSSGCILVNFSCLIKCNIVLRINIIIYFLLFWTYASWRWLFCGVFGRHKDWVEWVKIFEDLRLRSVHLNSKVCKLSASLLGHITAVFITVRVRKLWIVLLELSCAVSSTCLKTFSMSIKIRSTPHGCIYINDLLLSPVCIVILVFGWVILAEAILIIWHALFLCFAINAELFIHQPWHISIVKLLTQIAIINFIEAFLLKVTLYGLTSVFWILLVSQFLKWLESLTCIFLMLWVTMSLIGVKIGNQFRLIVILKTVIEVVIIL